MDSKPQAIAYTSKTEWRWWLRTNHNRQREVWLVLPKKSAGGDSYRVYYQQAVDEALCYGWIDSRIRRLDDVRSLVRFSPRKSVNWSASNIERLKELIEKGKMTQAGLRFVPSHLLESLKRPSAKSSSTHHLKINND